MTLAAFDFQEHNHFVAMEYHTLILNRTFLILITNDYLIGIQANGLVSAESGNKIPLGLEDVLTKAIGNLMAVRGDLSNPYAYIKQKYIQKSMQKDLLSDNLLAVNKINFRINKTDIKTVRYDARKKWGMGPYPHDGKVYIETNNSKREFIILGAQSGKKIANWIEMSLPE